MFVGFFFVWFVADQISPHMARAYGFQYIPEGDPDRVRAFHKHYGTIKAPRTIFGVFCAGSLAAGKTQLFGVAEDVWIFAFLISSLFWMVTAMSDVKQARDHMVKDHDHQG